MGHGSHFAKTHQRASKSVLGTYAINAQLNAKLFTERNTSKNNAKTYSIGTHTRTFEIFVTILPHCCTIVTLLPRRNTVAQLSQWCLCNIVAKLPHHWMFTFCSFVRSAFVPILFSTLNKAGTKRERDPPSGGQLFYSLVRPFRGVFWKPIDTIVNI